MRHSLGTTHLVLLLPVLASAGWIGCGSGAMPPRVRPTPSDCARPRPPVDVATLRVGLSGALDPDRITAPESDAERVVFHHLYETLIRLDCDSQPRVALARSWARERVGRSWRFTLGDDARFWDGQQVTADDVRSAWRTYGGDDFLTSIGAIADSIRVEGARELVIPFHGAAPEVPTAFADPALVVVRPSAISPWPRGTGPYRPVEERKVVVGAAGRRIVPAERMSGRDIEGPYRLEFIILPQEKVRDLIDEGIEILITRDPATTRYAVTGDDRITFPLAWDRVYALALYDGGDGEDPVDRTALDELLADLARDAVRAEARPARVTSAPASVQACVGLRRPEDGPIHAAQEIGSSRRILYPRDDAVARGLAERLVALRSSGRVYRPGPEALVHTLLDGGEDWTAWGIDGPPRAARGSQAVQIFSFPRYRACPSTDERERGERVLPLIETRAHVIAGRESGAVVLDGFGSPLLFRPRASAPAERGQ